MEIGYQLYPATVKPHKLASPIAVTRTFKVNLVGTLRALEALPKVKLQLNRVFTMETLLN